MTDPIADLLTRIRNANMRKLNFVNAPATIMKKNIVLILHKEGFIDSFSLENKNKFSEIKIKLKYLQNGNPVIRNIQRESKPGLRLYLKSTQIKPILGGQGISIISTSKGIKTDKECRKEKIGGEILCSIW